MSGNQDQLLQQQQSPEKITNILSPRQYQENDYNSVIPNSINDTISLDSQRKLNMDIQYSPKFLPNQQSIKDYPNHDIISPIAKKQDDNIDIRQNISAKWKNQPKKLTRNNIDSSYRQQQFKGKQSSQMMSKKASFGNSIITSANNVSFSKQIQSSQKFQLGRLNQSDEEIETKKNMKIHMEKALFLGKMNRIRQSMTKVLKNTESRRFQMLTHKNLKTLQDNSHYFKTHKKNLNFRQQLNKCLLNLDKHFGRISKSKPFHPYNPVNTVFQIFENTLILVDFMLYTWFCFFNYFEKEFFFYLCLVSLFVFLTGTFLRLNTGYFDQGVTVYDRSKIFKKYRQELFFNDIIGYVGFLFQLYTNNNDITTKQLSFFLILKYKVFQINLQKLEERWNMSGNMVHLYELIKLMGNALALCHIVGTGYYFLAVCERDYFGETKSWIQVLDIEHWEAHEKYTESFYWALATITLIGTKGETQLETLYCIFSLIWTIGVFATILSQVSIVWEEMAKKEKEYKKYKEVLNNFFKFHNITTDLQGQLHNYLKYSSKGHREKTANHQFSELMQTFPVGLQEMVKVERYSQELKNFSLLTSIFSNTTIDNLINYVQEEYYMPNQIIFQRDVFKEPRLYIILVGEALVYQDTQPKPSVISKLKAGDFFGYYSFFTNYTPYYSVRSNDDSFLTVLTISKSNFEKILNLNGNESDKEKFATIRDEILIKGFSQQLNLNCLICQSHDHSERNCNLLNYNPSKRQLIAKDNHSVQQQRQDFSKRIDYKMDALQYLYEIQETSNNILYNPDLRNYLKTIQEYQKQQEQMILEEIEEDSSEYSDDEFYENDNFTQYYSQKNNDSIDLGNEGGTQNLLEKNPISLFKNKSSIPSSNKFIPLEHVAVEKQNNTFTQGEKNNSNTNINNQNQNLNNINNQQQNNTSIDMQKSNLLQQQQDTSYKTNINFVNSEQNIQSPFLVKQDQLAQTEYQYRDSIEDFSINQSQELLNTNEKQLNSPKTELNNYYAEPINFNNPFDRNSFKYLLDKRQNSFKNLPFIGKKTSTSQKPPLDISTLQQQQSTYSLSISQVQQTQLKSNKELQNQLQTIRQPKKSMKRVKMDESIQSNKTQAAGRKKRSREFSIYKKTFQNPNNPKYSIQQFYDGQNRVSQSINPFQNKRRQSKVLGQNQYNPFLSTNNNNISMQDLNQIQQIRRNSIRRMTKELEQYSKLDDNTRQILKQISQLKLAQQDIMLQNQTFFKNLMEKVNEKFGVQQVRTQLSLDFEEEVQYQIMDEKQFLTIESDKMELFQFYFIHNNYDKVLHEIRQKFVSEPKKKQPKKNNLGNAINAVSALKQWRKSATNKGSDNSKIQQD